MPYNKTNWQDSPSTATPLDAANLLKMEQGIADAAEKLGNAGTRSDLSFDTAANWASSNPILGTNEVAHETDTGMVKVGDGVTHYNSLHGLVTGVDGNTGAVSLSGSYTGLSIGTGGPTTRLRAVAIGDSTTAGGLRSTDGTVVQVGNTWPAMDAIGVQRAGPQSWFTWACLLSGGRLLNVYNAGIHSDTTNGMVARFTTDVINKQPDVVFLGDAHNDFSTGSGITMAQTRANIVSMITSARKAGIMPILRLNYPDNSSVYASSLRVHNAWLKRYAAKNHLICVDTYSPVVDATSTTGAWVAANTSDGTHATTAGAILAAQRVLADMAGVLRGNTTAWGPWASTDRVQDVNKLANPLMQDDANADGKADNWTVIGTTPSIVTDSAVVGKAQQVVISSSTGQINQQVNVDGTSFSVGDRVLFAGVAKVLGASGSLNFDIEVSFPGVSTYIVKPLDQTVGVDTGWFYFECEAIIPSAATLMRAGIYTYAGTGTLLLAQPSLVNLTKQGIVTP